MRFRATTLLFIATLTAFTMSSSFSAESAVSLLKQMIAIGADNGGDGKKDQIEALKQRIDALPKPAKGNVKTARAANDKGLIAFKASNWEEAKVQFLAAYRADPTDVEIATNLALAYLRSGDYKEALKPISDALALMPSRAASWATLAEYYALQDKLTEAAACYGVMYQLSTNQEKTRQALENLVAGTVTNQDPRVVSAARQALQFSAIGGKAKEPLDSLDAPLPLAGKTRLQLPPEAAEKPKSAQNVTIDSKMNASTRSSQLEQQSLSNKSLQNVSPAENVSGEPDPAADFSDEYVNDVIPPLEPGELATRFAKQYLEPFEIKTKSNFKEILTCENAFTFYRSKAIGDYDKLFERLARNGEKSDLIKLKEQCISEFNKYNNNYGKQYQNFYLRLKEARQKATPLPNEEILSGKELITKKCVIAQECAIKSHNIIERELNAFPFLQKESREITDILASLFTFSHYVTEIKQHELETIEYELGKLHEQLAENDNKKQTEIERIKNERASRLAKAKVEGEIAAKSIGIKWELEEKKDPMTDKRVLTANASFAGNGGLEIQIEAACSTADKELTIIARSFDKNGKGVAFSVKGDNPNQVSLVVRLGNSDPVPSEQLLLTYNNKLDITEAARANCTKTIASIPGAALGIHGAFLAAQTTMVFTGNAQREEARQKVENTVVKAVTELANQYPVVSCVLQPIVDHWLEYSEVRVQFPLVNGNVLAKIAPYERNFKAVLASCLDKSM